MTENQNGGWDLVHSYSRRQAIEDGVLVDLRQKPDAENPNIDNLDEVVANAGIRLPLAITFAAFEKYIALTPAAERAGNDIKGRLWDVLTMLRFAIRSNQNASEITFEFRCVVERIRPSRCFLKCVVGAGDASEPVMTLMLPEED